MNVIELHIATTKPEYREAFYEYIRTGNTAAMHALGIEPNASGYLLPGSTEMSIDRCLARLSPVRSIADVRRIVASGSPESMLPDAESSFPAMELYAMPAATASLLEDSAVDLDQWIASEVEAAFAEQEGTAFVTGDGTNKPKGFLDYTAVADGSWSWGNLGYVATGVDGALPASNPSDKLIDLIYSLRAGYRQNASFVMNRKIQASIRKLKDADGNYLWQPPADHGARARLMGFPIVESDDMPDIGVGSTPIAFGDFARAYMVVDRAGVRVLRDPYSAKPYVLFYTTKRVGGGVQDFNAIKLLKFSER